MILLLGASGINGFEKKAIKKRWKIHVSEIISCWEVSQSKNRPAKVKVN